MKRVSALVMVGVLTVACGVYATAGQSHTRTATIARRALDPSGQPIPKGSPRGWKRIFADSFNTASQPCWGKYAGVPASSPTGYWAPSHVVFSGGMAQIRAYRDPAYGDRWTSGGMAMCLRRTYGMYKVRFKMNGGSGVKYAILLWPSHESWPCGGEIDWGEDGGGDRRDTFLTSIYCGSGGQKEQLPQVRIGGDFARWNTLEIRWTRGMLVEFLDGRRVGTIKSSAVPSDSMFLAIQTETNTNCGGGGYSCINASTPSRVTMDVDWVTAYEPVS